MWWRRAGVWAAIGTILVWASAFSVIRVGLRHFGPTELGALRVGSAALAFAVVAPLTRVGLPRRHDLPRMVAAGLIGMTVYQTLLNNGEEVVEAGTASILIATAPVWVAVMSMVVLGERLGWRGWLGIGIAFAGSTVVGAAAGGVRAQGLAVLILVAALAQATYIVLTKPLMDRYRPIQVASWAMWVGAIGFLPLARRLPEELTAAPAEGWLAALYLGLVPSALGVFFWARALVDAPASVVSSALYTIPPLAALMAWVFLGEVPAAGVWLGGVVILTGVVLVVRYGSGRTPSAPPRPSTVATGKG